MRQLSSPKIFLIGMITFLAVVSFVALILNQAIIEAFSANTGINSLILAVLAFGSLFAFSQVFRLFREIEWVNAWMQRRIAPREPILLAPISILLQSEGGPALSPVINRTILDSVGIRLDESRELNRYLIGLLVFLGLLGTFWGLLQTVHSISQVIGAMHGGNNNATMFEDLKSGLAAPLAGMSVSFTSSLFGLAGSLILGFLDLQAGQAQNHFYTELEDFLAEQISHTPGTDTPNLDNLAEGLRGLVLQMREEQKQIRDWVERQAAVQEDIRRLLRKLSELR